MLDYVCVFTKGGSLLWALSFVGLKGDPINTLIRACLLEERAGQSSFEYVIPSGGTYAVKWSLNNVRSSCTPLLCPVPTLGKCIAAPPRQHRRSSPWCPPPHAASVPAHLHRASSAKPFLPSSLPQGLGLVFVAVYQKALKLLYVDELLERFNRAFSPRYRPNCYAYPEFDAAFQASLLSLQGVEGGGGGDGGRVLQACMISAGRGDGAAGWGSCALCCGACGACASLEMRMPLEWSSHDWPLAAPPSALSPPLLAACSAC